MTAIYLNAQLISDQEGYRGAGVSNYARQLLAALGAEALAGRTAHTFTAFVHARRLAVPGVTLVQAAPQLEHPIARIAWEQVVWPRRLAARPPGIVHGLMNVLPLASPRGRSLAGVVTVHDLAFVRTPEKLPPLKRFYLTQLCAASVARARRVIAVSQQTAADVVDCLHADPAKVRVVHNGVAGHFTPGDPAEAARFRAEHNLPARFVLYLGTLEPRKNLDLLVRAYARWRQVDPAAAGVKLVLAGGKGWYFDTIFQTVAALGLAGDVVFPGYVPAGELPDWYRAATVFVYPSLFEGFGLPVLEAMACGAPVVCSRTPSLLEVAGDAALTVEAGDEAGLAHALGLLLGQPGLHAELAARGLVQAQRFTWRRCAEQTLAVYDEVAEVNARMGTRQPQQPADL